MTMATYETTSYTTKLNLKQPGVSELAKIADINDNMELIDSFASDIDSGKAATVYLTSSDTTWVQVYNKIKDLPLAKPATIYVNQNAISALTKGAYSTGTWVGLISRASSTTYYLMLKSSGQLILSGNLTNAAAEDSDQRTFTYYTKANDEAVVHNTGNETIAGNKYFTSSTYFTNGSTPAVYFRGQDMELSGLALRATNCEITGEKYGQPYFRFRAYSPESDGASRTSNYEDFDLPAVDSGRSNNATYKIITQKNISDLFTQLSCASGTNNFTIGKNSRIRIDLLTTNAARMGSILVSGNSAGTSVYYKADVGANVTVSASGGTLVITTNATIDMYCTVYAGSIAVAS